MNILEFFTSKNKEQIGSIECESSNLVSVFMSMASSMGLSTTPQATQKIITSSSKGISIKKKGNKFILILYSYNPPLEIEWVPGVTLSQMLDYLRHIAEQGKVVTLVNQVSPTTVQLALATD
ncbi:MAG: hypothetical protein KatS3mg085_573 [Candidatus Dojkabacteria bacterium]|nr:MAG: hypothetical protein KatS3mg085_573 [Candidatus Dojkabacteria bacterium]